MIVFSSFVHNLRSVWRKCPYCRRRQAVPRKLAGQTVKCKHCGASIPPSKNQQNFV
jgi:ribosomal protein S27E